MSQYARLLWTGTLLFLILGLCEDLNREAGSQERELRKSELTFLQAGLLPDLQGIPPLPESNLLSSIQNGVPGNRITDPERFLYITAKLAYIRMHSEFMTYKPGLLLRTGIQLRKHAFAEYPAAG
jgi:hypothetical protein